MPSSIRQFYADQAARRAQRLARTALGVSITAYLPIVTLVWLLAINAPDGEVSGGLVAQGLMVALLILLAGCLAGGAMALYARRAGRSRAVRAALVLSGIGLAAVVSCVVVWAVGAYWW